MLQHNSSPINFQTLLNQEQASEFLGLSPRTLELWRRRGIGPSIIRLSRRSIRYDHADLLNWVASRKQVFAAEVAR